VRSKHLTGRGLIHPLIYHRIDRTLSPCFASDHENKEEHSLTLVFGGGEGQLHALATLPQEKSPWYAWIEGSRRKISAPAEN